MSSFKAFLAAAVRDHSLLRRALQAFTRSSFPDQVVFLDYPVRSRERWTREAPNPHLFAIIDRYREEYRRRLQSFLAFKECLMAIPVDRTPETPATEPVWRNTFFPALDAVALYGLLKQGNPKLYIEVGSGNSTKFARRAVVDHQLATRIVSIDPNPRLEIDAICDEVIRQPLENVPLELFDRLEKGDILFIDSSHGAFMNSDVTALFLDVIPRLKQGVLLQIHDIFLPCDYPSSWTDRNYSEQYLLAASLLAGERLEILLPNMFISRDADLASILDPIWKMDRMLGVDVSGGSFWLRIK